MSSNPYEIRGSGGTDEDSNDTGTDDSSGGGGYEGGSSRPVWETNRHIDREDIIQESDSGPTDTSSSDSSSGGRSFGSGAAPGQSQTSPAEIGPSGGGSNEPLQSPDGPTAGPSSNDESGRSDGTGGSSSGGRSFGSGAAPGQSQTSPAEIGPSGGSDGSGGSSDPSSGSGSSGRNPAPGPSRDPLDDALGGSGDGDGGGQPGGGQSGSGSDTEPPTGPTGSGPAPGQSSQAPADLGGGGGQPSNGGGSDQGGGGSQSSDEGGPALGPSRDPLDDALGGSGGGAGGQPDGGESAPESDTEPPTGPTGSGPDGDGADGPTGGGATPRPESGSDNNQPNPIIGGGVGSRDQRVDLSTGEGNDSLRSKARELEQQVLEETGAEDPDNVQVVREDGQLVPVVVGGGDRRVRQDIRAEVAGGVEGVDPGEVRLRRGDEGVQAELTDQGRVSAAAAESTVFDRSDLAIKDGEVVATDDAQQERRTRTLEGLGFEMGADGELQAPDAPGQDTLAEQRASERRTRTLEGLGFKLGSDGELQAPEAAGQETVVERRASERQARLEAGLGIERGADGEVRFPVAAGQETVAERRASERQARVETGLGIERGADGEVQLPDAAGSETIEDQFDLTRSQRQEIRQQAAEEFSEQTGEDISPTWIDVEVNDGQIGASIDKEAYESQRDRPLGNVQETQLGRDIVGGLEDWSGAIRRNVVNPVAEGAGLLTVSQRDALGPRAYQAAQVTAEEDLTLREGTQRYLTGGQGVDESLAERSTESFVQGGGLLLDFPGAARGLINIGDYAGAGASAAISGQGGDVVSVEGNVRDSIRTNESVEVRFAEGGFAGASQDAGEQIIAEAQQSFRERPVETTAAATGALVGTAVTTAGAARISSTAGQAVPYAFQPGEELLTFGATQTLGRTARGQRILSRFPGERIDNEEIVLREANRAIQGTRERLRLGARSLDETDFGIAERVPETNVRTEQRRGRLPAEVNVAGDLRPDIRGRARDARERLQDAAPGTDDLQNLRPELNVRERVGGLRPEFGRSGDGIDLGVGDAVSQAPQRVRLGAARARREVSELPSRARQEFELARRQRGLDSLGDRARIIGDRARRRGDDLSDLPQRVLEEGRLAAGEATSGAESVIDQITTGLSQTRYRTGTATRRRVDALSDLPQRAREEVQLAAGDIESVFENAREGVASLPARADQARARAGRRIGGIRSGLSDEFSRGEFVETDPPEDLTDIPRDRWGDLSESQRRELSQQLIDQINEREGVFGPTLDDVPFSRPSTDVLNRLSSLRDQQVRIDIGVPSRRTVFVDEARGAGQQPVDLPGPELESELPYEPGEVEIETGGETEFNVVQSAETRTDSGVAVQRVIETESETETEPEGSDLPFATEMTGGGADAIFDDVAVAGGDGGASDDLEGFLDAAQDPVIELSAVTRPAVDLESEREPVRIESPFEGIRGDGIFEREQEIEAQRFETELEQELETETETETELETETETEFETEFEFEREFEYETEAEPFTFDQRIDRDGPAFGIGARDETFETTFASAEEVLDGSEDGGSEPLF